MPTPDHRRLRELFHQVVQLPEQERSAFLKQSCAEDPLHLRAVQHLLDYHRTATLLASGKDTASDGDSGGSTEVDSVQPRRSHCAAIVSQAGQLLRGPRRWPWWLIALTCGVLLIGLMAQLKQAVQRQIDSQVATALKTIVAEQVLALEIWLDAEARLYSNWAQTNAVAQTVAALNAAPPTAPPEQLAELGKPLRELLATLLPLSDRWRYAVWNRQFRLVADSDPASPVIGNPSTDYGSQILSQVFRGESVVWTPSTEGYITSGLAGNMLPTMSGIAIIVPILDGDKRPIAALMIAGEEMQIRFEELLRQAWHGESGEAYAVDRNGFFISESRFGPELKIAGLIADQPDSLAALTLRVAVPNGDIRNAGRTDISTLKEWPLTKAARLVTRGQLGSDVMGYLDYRGVEVVGAWRWLADHRFGIIVEADTADVHAALLPLQYTQGILAVLCSLVTLIAVGYNLRGSGRQSEIPAHIGPYTIEHRIDEGGLAHVYLATHQLLKRPTALKLLKPTHANDVNLRRFEREVQLACRLSHPNTIEVYDYGRTRHGEFYCAMEFISGFNLQTLITIAGPLPVARVVHILTGMCNSLNEAHQLGLIHRDIKPHNVMLCFKGGEADFVKVLDFGLAREIVPQRPTATDTQLLVGTPMFIAPERIADPSCVDPRSDIFSLGIVGYILLTGSEPHASANSVDALLQTMREDPVPPSRTAPHVIPAELDQLICDCQARNLRHRPQSVQIVLERLRNLSIEPWSQAAAQDWWRDFSDLRP